MQSSSHREDDKKISTLADEHSYPLWEYAAMPLLEEYGLTQYVRTDDPAARPDIGSEGYNDFRAKETKVIRFLFNSLHRNFQALVLGENTIVGFMANIRNRFEGRESSQTISSTVAELTKQCTDGNIVQRIADMNISFATLLKLGTNFSDEVKIGFLYGAMPSSLAGIRKLLDKTRNTSYSHACNEYCRASSEARKSNHGEQALITCYRCGKSGHISIH